MGRDFAMASDDAHRQWGSHYRHLKTEICKLLDLECEFEKTGPGEYVGVSDARVIEELKKRLERP